MTKATTTYAMKWLSSRHSTSVLVPPNALRTAISLRRSKDEELYQLFQPNSKEAVINPIALSILIYKILVKKYG